MNAFTAKMLKARRPADVATFDRARKKFMTGEADVRKVAVLNDGGESDLFVPS